MESMRKWFGGVVASIIFAGCGVDEGEDLSLPDGYNDPESDPDDNARDALHDTGCGTTPPSSCSGRSCAGSGSGTTGSSGTAGAGSYQTAPFVRSARTSEVLFHRLYVGYSLCAEIRGNLPGMSWSNGYYVDGASLRASDSYQRSVIDSGYLPVPVPPGLPAGTYDFTYGARECPGSSYRFTWADYGSGDKIHRMPESARSYIYCSWWDASRRATVTPPAGQSSGCNLRVSIDNYGSITAAGNMRNYQ